jgi:hypothetical protein
VSQRWGLKENNPPPPSTYERKRPTNWSNHEGKTERASKANGASKATPPGRLGAAVARPETGPGFHPETMQQDCCSEMVPSAGRATPGGAAANRQNESGRGFRPSNPATTGRRRKPAPPCSHRRWGSISVAAHHLQPLKLHRTVTVPNLRRCVGPASTWLPPTQSLRPI